MSYASMPTRSGHLDGLNGLRFIAAFFVLIAHAHESVIKLGLARPLAPPFVFFDRGRAAVDFFFTLSGFLITYLLLLEASAWGDLSLKRFYVRRMRRIWPLYFLVLAVGFVLFAAVYPRIYHERYFQFGIGSGLLLYLFFLPNLMASLYKVGMLNPLWSIGVEEQFYLAWAPLVKWARRRILTLILGAIAGTLTLSVATALWAPSLDPRAARFLDTLHFQYMAVGALFAWILLHRYGDYLRSVFATRAFQWFNILVLAYHYAFGLPGREAGWVVDVLLACLYGTLIMNVSVVPAKVLDLEWAPLARLGVISYGIYMFHMSADYLLRMGLARTTPSAGAALGSAVPVTLMYGGVLLAVTIVLAEISFRYFESRFTRRHEFAPKERVLVVAPPPVLSES
jgi:peptidoglycan/LPS O-acetylase OafA/YrhL